MDKYCLWAIIDEKPETWTQEDDSSQPYTLKKCEFVPALSHTENKTLWESIRPAVASNAMENLLFNYQDFESIRNRIFDGNNYSFDVVNRAVQVYLAEHNYS
jgi:hypothetical protein